MLSPRPGLVVVLCGRRGEDGRLRPPAAGGAGGERSEPPLMVVEKALTIAAPTPADTRAGTALTARLSQVVLDAGVSGDA